MNTPSLSSWHGAGPASRTDPLADGVRDTAKEQQGGLAACLKKVGHLTKGLRKSLGLTDL